MYLASHWSAVEKKMFFSACSDALISSGLAALLLFLYNERSPLLLIRHPPTLFEKIGLYQSLTLGRVQGVSSLYREMTKRALPFLNQISDSIVDSL